MVYRWLVLVRAANHKGQIARSAANDKPRLHK